MFSNVAMAYPRGEKKQGALRVDFDRRLKLEFHGSRVTSDAGLLAYRELDDGLRLTEMVGDLLADSRTGRNGRHCVTGQFRRKTSRFFRKFVSAALLPILIVTHVPPVAAQENSIQVKFAGVNDLSKWTLFLYSQCRVYLDVRVVLPQELDDVRISIGVSKADGEFYGTYELTLMQGLGKIAAPSESGYFTLSQIVDGIRCKDLGAINVPKARCRETGNGWFDCTTWIKTGEWIIPPAKNP